LSRQTGRDAIAVRANRADYAELQESFGADLRDFVLAQSARKHYCRLRVSVFLRPIYCVRQTRKALGVYSLLDMKRRPGWWDWELEISPHLLKRMADRDFTELDVRSMLQDATRVRPDVAPGRWIVSTHRRRRRWEVIVEPDPEVQVLIVITAYPVSP